MEVPKVCEGSDAAAEVTAFRRWRLHPLLVMSRSGEPLPISPDIAPSPCLDRFIVSRAPPTSRSRCPGFSASVRVICGYVLVWWLAEPNDTTIPGTGLM